MKAHLLLLLSAIVALSNPSARAQEVAGIWQGTIAAKESLRTVVKITNDDKQLKGTLYSIDQDGDPIALSSIERHIDTLNFAVAVIDGTFSGKFSADGNSIVGTWTQGKQPLPLTLIRVSQATAWDIPKPTQLMARDADPSFDVATIKPSKPEDRGKGFGVDGRNVSTENTSLDDLIEYAYDVHLKQIVGAPGWADSQKFDIAGVPDKPGEPSDEQTKSMIQKLLVDRFQLKFHQEKRVLSVYILSLAKDGPQNVTKSADPNPGFSIPVGRARGGMKLTVENGTMTNFAIFGLQGTVLDRPVLDQTGLTDRYDFTLTWMPDSSQFGGTFDVSRVKHPTSDIFTAIQEQLAMKLEPKKAPVDVMVVDHVEEPSPN
jgi:uncharacterized protein (TIGR03435 family)